MVCTPVALVSLLLGACPSTDQVAIPTAEPPPTPLASPAPAPAATPLVLPQPIPEAEPPPEDLLLLGEGPAPVRLLLPGDGIDAPPPVPEEEPDPAGTQAVEEHVPLPRLPRQARGTWGSWGSFGERGATGSCGGHEGSAAGASFTLEGHVFTTAWIERTLHGVIANHCQSKTYTDILALDGGTVGICHFASGSLLTLYRQMNVSTYFGPHAGHIPDRPYRLDWWREGMRRFLRSPEGRGAQQRAWRLYISPALTSALRHGWSSDRELAIAASVANSLGAGGFQQIAQQNGWLPERTLLSYARRTAHKERRRQRLNREFPVATPQVALARE